MTEEPSAYAAAGVDIAAGERAVDLMRNWVETTRRAEVLTGLGGFAGLFDAARLAQMRHPVLATSTDGVGTKVAIAQAMGVHDTIGFDLVGMVVDDLVVCGAEPLFMTDYIACGKVEPAGLPGELDLAPYRHAAADGAHQERVFARDPRAGNHQFGHVQLRERIIVAERDFRRQDVLGQHGRGPFEHRHARALRHEKARDALSRLSGTEDRDRLFRQGRHRSLSVLSASSAQMMETIQKRTMICGSGQPSSSKW